MMYDKRVSFAVTDSQDRQVLGMNEHLEQTLVLIKPDALKQSLTGYILSTLSEFHTGLRFAGIKVVHVSRLLAEEHYREHKGKSFFEGLVEFITGCYHYPNDPQNRRVLAFVYSGLDAIQKMRGIAGPTNPHQARDERPGTIRSLGTVVQLHDENGKVVGDRFDNLIHASDSAQSAEREIKLWFKPNDIPPHIRLFPTEQCDQLYYYKEDHLFTRRIEGSICLLAPGDIAWKSDVETLNTIEQGYPTERCLASVAAKYLINELEEE